MEYCEHGCLDDLALIAKEASCDGDQMLILRLRGSKLLDVRYQACMLDCLFDRVFPDQTLRVE